jgi:hypothetical protein
LKPQPATWPIKPVYLLLREELDSLINLKVVLDPEALALQVFPVQPSRSFGFNLNSEIEQVVLLLVLVLDKSPYLSSR